MNPQTRALAIKMLREGKPLGEIGDATGLMDREVIAVAKEVSQHVGTTTPGSAPPPFVRPSRATITIPPAAPGPSPIGRLLEDASGHSVAKIRNLASRIETQLDQLRAFIAEYAQAEQAKQKAAAERAAAAARVKELEEQLRAAKAALRGKPPAKTSTAEPKTTEKSCTDCGKPVVRRPGQTRPTPKRCDTCKAAAA